MKPERNRYVSLWRTMSLAGVLVVGLWAVSSAWAAGKPQAAGANGTWKFAILGDHRGDNDPGGTPATGYSKLVLDPDTGKYIGFKDMGIAVAAVQGLAQAVREEAVEFVLNVGDLVTKHIPEINGKSADELMAEELSLWALIWNENSGNMPLYPVRGNQEYTASEAVWLNFTAGMPGIGSLPLNGPEGEQGLTYAFHYKNCLIVGIDHYVSDAANGDSHVITPAAQQWFAQVMADSDRPFKFVFGHTPAYEVWNTKKAAFSAIKDGIADPYAKFTLASLLARDAFWNSLGNAGAEYFCGHEHMFARGVNTVAGRLVRQTIIGNGGAPASPAYDLTKYTLGPFAESYSGRVLPSLKTDYPTGYILTDPLITAENYPRGGISNETPPPPAEVGYVVITVHGSHVTATYKALNGSYQESWLIAGTPE